MRLLGSETSGIEADWSRPLMRDEVDPEFATGALFSNR